MAPAQEGFAPADPALAQVHDRLIVNVELPFGEGLPKLLLQDLFRLEAIVHLDIKKAVGSSPVSLRIV